MEVVSFRTERWQVLALSVNMMVLLYTRSFFAFSKAKIEQGNLTKLAQ